MAPVLEAALAAHQAGLCPIRAATDGSKRPAGQWKQWQQQRPTVEQVETWFAGGWPGLGLVCGAVSDGLFMIELEGRAVEAGLADQLDAAMDAAGLADLWQRVVAGYTERTPSDGLHVLCKVVGPVPGNHVLAADERGRPLIETRGEGGFVVVAPSNGTTHPSGGCWERVYGGFDRLVTVTGDELDALLDVCRTFDRRPARAEPAPAAPGPAVRPAGAGWVDAVIADFNARTSWDIELASWGERVGSDNGDDLYHRHGSVNEVGARVSRATDRVRFFSSTVPPGIRPFDGGRLSTYDRFSWRCVLTYGSDDPATRVRFARELNAQGYGPSWDADVRQVVDGTRVSLPRAAGPGAASTPDTGSSDPSCWQPVDLGPAWRGEKTEPPAVVFTRSDGQAILPPGLSLLWGDSGDGKSFVAQVAALQELRAGRPVIWVTYEDPNELTVVERFRQLGATGADISRLLLVIAQDSLWDGTPHLVGLVGRHQARLLVLDSIGEAMAVSQVNEDKDAEVGPWFRATLRAIVDACPDLALIGIDHSTKAKDSLLFPAGSKRKRAAITARGFLLNVRRPLGRDRAGMVQLVVAKDRTGVFARGDIAAEVTIDATVEPYEVRVDPARTGDRYDPQLRRRTVEDRCLEALSLAAVPLTAAQVHRLVNNPDRRREGEPEVSFGSVRNALHKLRDRPEVRSSRPAGPSGATTATVYQAVLPDEDEQ